MNREQRTKSRAIVLCGIAAGLFLGCVSLMEKAGQALDGSAFAEKNIAIYRASAMEVREVENKAEERSIIITLNEYPAMRLRGSAPNEQGEFHFTSLDYLGGNTNGWNEYRLELFGSGNLVLGEDTARLFVGGEIEAVQISSGRIRRYDTRLTGNEALASLRNRRERILALTEWMAEFAASPPATADRDEFDAYWNPVLFPEIASKKKQPQDWQREDDQWVKAEDIRWNTSYTERILPEELRAIRNSGTLLRDWEEALEWIYIESEWSRIIELLARETVLNRAKK